MGVLLFVSAGTLRYWHAWLYLALFVGMSAAITVDLMRRDPDAVVRHPMYASALLYLIGTPLALGSYEGLLALAFMLPFLIWRLIDEERLLARDLRGYADYQERVRYRLMPFVW
jgi:protein-S-isoprenylcysteine O-methyltransferase Ste14